MKKVRLNKYDATELAKKFVTNTSGVKLAKLRENLDSLCQEINESNISEFKEHLQFIPSRYLNFECNFKVSSPSGSLRSRYISTTRKVLLTSGDCLLVNSVQFEKVENLLIEIDEHMINTRTLITQVSELLYKLATYKRISEEFKEILPFITNEFDGCNLPSLPVVNLLSELDKLK